MAEKDKKKHKPGPEHDRLKIDEDDWEEAVRKAINKRRPKGGWPRPEENEDSE